jgi:hypothetical protein
MSSQKGPDPGSEIRDPEKIHPGSGSRITGVKKHRIPDPDLQHWIRGKEKLPYIGTCHLWKKNIENIITCKDKRIPYYQTKYRYIILSCNYCIKKMLPVLLHVINQH